MKAKGMPLRFPGSATQNSVMRRHAKPPRGGTALKTEGSKGLTGAISVFIVAASPLARAGLETLLGTRSVKVAGNAPSLGDVAKARGTADVVLVDSAGTAHGTLLDSILTSGLASRVSVVLLADIVSPEALDEMYRAGVKAVLPGGTSPNQLLAALFAAAHGLVAVLPLKGISARSPASRVLRAVNEMRKPLTRREREVLQCLAAGHSNKEVAGRLGVSERTAKFHVASIISKLGATTRTDAVAMGIRRGLVAP
jgi:DNA-binding NarL/FixJ family response regulator